MPNGSVDVNFNSAPNIESYVDNVDGTITDLVTLLMWQKAVDPGNYTWQEAKVYCSTTVSKMGLGGYHDWRLPSEVELMSLIDLNVATPIPAISAKFFPNTPSDYFWSATPRSGPAGYAWVVNFDNTASVKVPPTTLADNLTSMHWVRCVR